MNKAKKNQKITLLSPISKVPNLTSYYVGKMHKLGIKTIYDLLTYFPFRYNDFDVKNLAQVPDGSKVTLRGTVSNQPNVRTYGYRRNRFYFRMVVGADPQHGYMGNQVWVSFFNQPWLAKKVHYGQVVTVYGRLDVKRQGLNASKLLNSKQAHQIDSVYKSTKGVHQKTIRKSVKACYDSCHGLIRNFLPKSVMKEYMLEPETQVIHDLQFPSSGQEEKMARRTAKFNDFFLFQMRLQMMKQNHHAKPGISIKYKKSIMDKFYGNLPFKLTHAQARCVNEILTDLKSNSAMQRLLQGDVGSGKTIVAVCGILATFSAGYQSALMVPTSVLAGQHAKNLSNVLKGFHINIALLTGDTTPKAKTELLKHLANGDIDLVIGTDALIQDDVKFKNLGFVVVDEEHKFGVDQRNLLKHKNHGVNFLSMSATPIPRTLAMTTYGNMDVSVIDQLPKGRKPIKTRWIRLSQMHGSLKFIDYLMAHHQQVYVVAPLVKQTKGTQSSDLLDAETIYHTFKYYFGKKYKIGLVNGQMKDEDKDKTMKDFKKGKIQMLVATTVIEVGIDVKNASLMIIMDAQNFGLAQIHQLRGRVGRGSQQAYCLLVTNDKVSKVGQKRMRIMESSTNGFKIAEADLELRHFGNLLGSEQSGLSDDNFKVADAIGDRKILPYARAKAGDVISEPNWDKLPKNKNLVYILRVKQKLNDINLG